MEKRKIRRETNEDLITKIINTASNKLGVDNISKETRLKVSRQLRYTCSDTEKLTKILENIRRINKDVDIETQKNVTLIIKIIENGKQEKGIWEKFKSLFG